MCAWLEYVERLHELHDEERRIRTERSGLDALNRCISRENKLVAEAASRLPSDGAAASWIERTLVEADLDSPDHRFVLAVLVHRKQFPRRYLLPLVHAAARAPTGSRGNVIAAASAAYGRSAVLRALLDVAKTGELPYERARFLAGYAGTVEWMKSPPSARPVEEYDLYVELIRISSGGTAHSTLKRPSGDG